MMGTTTSQANNQPQQTALQQLQQLQQQFQQLHLNQLFAQDPQRFQRFSVDWTFIFNVNGLRENQLYRTARCDALGLAFACD